MYPAGDAAIEILQQAREYPFKDIKAGAEKKLSDESRIGSAYWNRGLGAAAVTGVYSSKNA